MRRALLPAVVVLLALFLGWWWAKADEAEDAPLGVPASTGEREEVVADLRARDDPAVTGTDAQATHETEDSVETEESAPSVDGPDSPVVDNALDPAAERIDRGERRKLFVRVLDGTGTLVPGASVWAYAFRTRRESAAHWLRSEPVRTNTGMDGLAVIEYAVWATREGEWYETGEITLRVEHPAFCTFVGDVSVDEGEATVVLERGTALIVSGWIESPAERIIDVDPVMCNDVRIRDEDWVRSVDGRLSCNKIPLGTHGLALNHVRDGVSYTSEFTSFELLEREQKELHLRLAPTLTVVGTLDPVVPRPVIGGEVEIRIRRGREQRQRSHTAEVFARTAVEPDGSFTIAGLPPGTAEIYGMCEGWSATPVAWDGGEKQFPPPLPLEAEEGFVLRMTRTASVLVTVLDLAGEPLPSVLVQARSAIFWCTGTMSLPARDEWRATTNGAGIAHLENLPTLETTSLWIEHALLVWPTDRGKRETGRQEVELELTPGETTRLTVRLEDRRD